MTVAELGTAGGLFAVLTFNHFLVDWVFQTHDEAMNKSTSWVWRAQHCFLYTAGFLPVLWLLGLSPIRLVLGCLILFWSHFLEDTYIPVYLWAKYIRRMPELRHGSEVAFKDLFKTPLGLVLFITIDQIIHLCFLWAIVALVMYPGLLKWP